MRFSPGLAAVSVALLFSIQVQAQSPTGGREVDFTAVNMAILDEFLLPAYARLEGAAPVLDDAARTFCEKPGDAELLRVKDAWHGFMDRWQAVQHVSLGPVSFEMRRYRVQLWPDKRGNVGQHLRRLLAAADPGDLEAARFARGSVAVQGLSALEHLLFEDDPAAPDFTGENAFRCDVLTTITANLLAITRQVGADWRVGAGAHRVKFELASAGNAFYENEEALSEMLLRDLRMHLQFINEYKLARPLSDGVESIRPRRAESWRSARSLRNVRINLESLREQWRVGFAPVIGDAELRHNVTAAFDDALARVAGFERPLVDLIDDPDARGRLGGLIASVSELIRYFLGDVPRDLDLAAGLVSLDGD